MSERRFPAPAPRDGTPAQKSGTAAQAPRKPGAPAKHARKAEEPPARKTGYEGAPKAPAEADGHLQPGLKPVLELLEQSPGTIDTVFVRKGRKDAESDRILDLCREANVRFALVDDAFLARLYPGRHQGAIARLFAAGFHDLPDLLESACDAPLPLLLALDQVQDPGNAGALARTLYAMGGGGLIVPRHNGVYLGAAAAKVSAGALEKLPVAKVANLGQALDEAENAGFTLYGAWSGPHPEPARLENALTFIPRLPAVLVLGSEESGLRPHIAKRCSSLLRIPLARDFDSLGVAQAGAIIVSAFAARGAGKGRS